MSDMERRLLRAFNSSGLALEEDSPFHILPASYSPPSTTTAISATTPSSETTSNNLRLIRHIDGLRPPIGQGSGQNVAVLEAASFAGILGLVPDLEDCPWRDQDYFERDRLLGLYLGGLEEKSIRLRRKVTSEFCALYLVALVERFLDPPPLIDLADADESHSKMHKVINSYVVMMYIIRLDPYFAKFMLSSHRVAAKGRRMASSLATSMASELPLLDSMIRGLSTGSGVRSAEASSDAFMQVLLLCELLYVLVVFQTDAQNAILIPELARDQLLPYIDTWARMTKGTAAAATFERVSGLLRGDSSSVVEARKTRDKLENLQTCAREDCTKQYDLLQCSRCKTVLYCTPRHQRDHWEDYMNGKHRELCFATKY